jgi:type 1 glutamine amidotransferase
VFHSPFAAALLSLALATPGGPAPAPKRLLLVGHAPDGHPAGTHEYNAGLKILQKCLAKVPGVEVTVAHGDDPWRDGPELIGRADAVVLFVSEGARWMQESPQRFAALGKLAARGGGLVVLHWGMGAKDAKYVAGCVKLLGGCHGGPGRKYKVLEAKARVAAADHPVAAGLADFPVRDEFYYRLHFVRSDGLRPLLRVPIDGNDETVAWAWERPDGGRSFGFSGLHFHDNWRLPEYRRLVAQAALWALRLPVPAKGLDVHLAEKELRLK